MTYLKLAHELLTLFHRPCALAFLANFTLSDSTDLVRFMGFSQITLYFLFGQHSHVFRLTGTVQQCYTAGIPLLEAYLLPMASNQIRKEQRGPDSYACAFSAE